MKFFISHKQQDALIAERIALWLKTAGVEYYLDLLDPSISGNGEELTKHLKDALKKCTDIIVVISEKTRYSWWVPFEVGMAARTDMPTVTFLQEEVDLPGFLEYWPRLKKLDDLDAYLRVRRKTHEQMIQLYGSYAVASSYQAMETRIFYANLKKELR